MIVELHRPEQLSDALALLSRVTPRTLPLGGGTAMPSFEDEPVALVDVQGLGLDQAEMRGVWLWLGAGMRLSAVEQHTAIQPELHRVITAEAGLNVRQMATLGGSVASADGRSALLCALLALDARLMIEPGAQEIELSELIYQRSQVLRGKLITGIGLPANASLAVETVRRTPASPPMVIAAVVRWPSGRTRLAVGGAGSTPRLAMDGPEPGGIGAAAANALFDVEDFMASAEYRRAIAPVLAERALARLSSEGVEV